MKMISFYNKKVGVVGKKTLCKNVAYKFALENKKFLIIDLNPQATITFELKGTEVNLEKTISDCFVFNKNNSLKKVIQNTKYKEIDYIVGREKVKKVNFLLKKLYENNDKFFVAENIYLTNKETLDSYDYVLIDYPPTVDELSLNWLIISDLIIIPINEGLGAFKGILDLINTLKYICKREKRKIPEYKIILNTIKSDKNLILINEWLDEKGFLNYCFKIILKSSETFLTNENELASNWDSKYYWRQKQAYEELIKEIK
ncbi:ParA family protein [Spiroplasma endosymbiont of Polydrusus cervinus]|uniref:ParA family protein n=1 Tax=Spiroplasma endosymbiont of Polydrusus cervinus TaxID=3066287 RepID=UPI0030CBDE4B